MLKKIFNKLRNNSLFTFMLGIILCSGVVYGTSAYESNNIKYNPTDTSWGVTNVNDAINSLYSMKKELDTTKTSLNNLKGIGDATAEQILKGKKAVVKGSTITGTMKNMSNQWIWTSKGIEEYTYSSGSKANMVYVSSRDDHGDGYITTNTKFIVGTENDLKKSLLAGKTLLGVDGTATSDATATATDILSGKTAYVNGTKITGTMVNNGAVTKKIVGGGNYKIPSGYHNGSGAVNVSHLIKSWCPNYSPWDGYTSMHTTDTYTVSAKSLYVLVIAENGGTVYQQGSPTCTDGTVTLLVNSGAGILYKVDKTEAATFTLNVGISRNYSSYPNSTLRVYAFTNS